MILVIFLRDLSLSGGTTENLFISKTVQTGVSAGEKNSLAQSRRGAEKRIILVVFLRDLSVSAREKNSLAQSRRGAGVGQLIER